MKDLTDTNYIHFSTVTTSKFLDNYTGCLVFQGGTKEWRKEGKIHRADGPAVEYWNGNKEWWWNGEVFYSNRVFVNLKNNYIVVERGIPKDKMFGELRLTQTKLLTAEGTVFVYDNLPGMDAV
jgi:hypothetical protein